MWSPASVRQLLITSSVGAETEINKFDLLSSGVYQNVIKLDISMNNIVLVNVV